MNKLYSLVFGILFIGSFCLLAFNNFEFPKIFLNKPQTYAGIIVDIKPGYGIRGMGFVQHVRFIYTVNGEDFIGKKVVDKTHGIQHIGNRVIIRVSEKKPHRYRVVGFKQLFRGGFSDTFYSATHEVYLEIRLENSVYRYIERAKDGEIKKEVFGSYKLSHDTLFVSNFKLSDIQEIPDTTIYLTDYKEFEINRIIDDKSRTEYFR